MSVISVPTGPEPQAPASATASTPRSLDPLLRRPTVPRYHALGSFRGTDPAGSGNIIQVHTPVLERQAEMTVSVVSRYAPPDFLTVYDELFPFVWRLARRLGVPDAALDDVCQEVFVVVHHRLHEFEGRSSVKTWVYGIANNVVLTHRRGTRRKDAHRSAIDPETVIDEAPGPHDAASGAQAARIANALLAQLADDKRAVLVLVELEGMTVPEAADALQINLNTAYARLRTARAEFAAAVARFHARERRP